MLQIDVLLPGLRGFGSAHVAVFVLSLVVRPIGGLIRPAVLQGNGIDVAVGEHSKLDLGKISARGEPVITLQLFDVQNVPFVPVYFEDAHVGHVSGLDRKADLLQQPAQAHPGGVAFKIIAERRFEGGGILGKRQRRQRDLLRRQRRIVDQPYGEHLRGSIDVQLRLSEARPQIDEIILVHRHDRHKQRHVDGRILFVAKQGDVFDELHFLDGDLQLLNKVAEQQAGFASELIGIGVFLAGRDGGQVVGKRKIADLIQTAVKIIRQRIVQLQLARRHAGLIPACAGADIEILSRCQSVLPYSGVVHNNPQRVEQETDDHQHAQQPLYKAPVRPPPCQIAPRWLRAHGRINHIDVLIVFHSVSLRKAEDIILTLPARVI